jgi:hypothetical protein
VDHRGSSPPWTGLHCRLEELTRARPPGATAHSGLPRLHRKDEELARVRFRASPGVALGEGVAQAWREEKESRGRGGGGRWGSSTFIVAEGGGRLTIKAEKRPAVISFMPLKAGWLKEGLRGD